MFEELRENLAWRKKSCDRADTLCCYREGTPQASHTHCKFPSVSTLLASQPQPVTADKPKRLAGFQKEHVCYPGSSIPGVNLGVFQHSNATEQGLKGTLGPLNPGNRSLWPLA